MDWIEGLLRVYERTRGRGHTRIGIELARQEGALYIVQTDAARTALKKHPSKPVIITVAELPNAALGRSGPIILDNQVVISLLDEAARRGREIRVLAKTVSYRDARIKHQRFEIAVLTTTKENQQVQIARLRREQAWRHTWWGRWLYRIILKIY